MACAVDSVARAHPVLQTLYAVADLEHFFEAPMRFLYSAMAAFFAEVVVPVLRTLGFITVQTLG